MSSLENLILVQKDADYSSTKLFLPLNPTLSEKVLMQSLGVLSNTSKVKGRYRKCKYSNWYSLRHIPETFYCFFDCKNVISI